MRSFSLCRFSQLYDLLTSRTDRVAFLRDAWEWGGGEVCAYDYYLTPGGRKGSGRVTGARVLLRLCDNQPRREAHRECQVTLVHLKSRELNGAYATLACSVGE